MSADLKELHQLYVDMPNCDAVIDDGEFVGTCIHSSMLDRLARLINSISEELEQAKADAERYRWLRDDPNAYPCYVIYPDSMDSVDSADMDKLIDAAIDAAREAK